MAEKRGPRAPNALDDPGRELWADTVRALIAQGTWAGDHDREALHRYVTAVRTAHVMRAAAECQPLVKGSTGQVVAHPGFRVAAEADRDAARYAADLLLTPAARKRAGVVAHASDGALGVAPMGPT